MPFPPSHLKLKRKAIKVCLVKRNEETSKELFRNHNNVYDFLQ